MSGSVEVGELVPVIFNKASSPQHHLIRHLIEYENATVSSTMFQSSREVARVTSPGGVPGHLFHLCRWRSELQQHIYLCTPIHLVVSSGSCVFCSESGQSSISRAHRVPSRAEKTMDLCCGSVKTTVSMPTLSIHRSVSISKFSTDHLEEACCLL